MSTTSPVSRGASRDPAATSPRSNGSTATRCLRGRRSRFRTTGTRWRHGGRGSGGGLDLWYPFPHLTLPLGARLRNGQRLDDLLLLLDIRRPDSADRKRRRWGRLRCLLVPSKKRPVLRTGGLR